MSRVRKRYPRKFKLASLRLAETSGKTLLELGRDLGLSDGCLYHWRRELAGQNLGAKTQESLFSPEIEIMSLSPEMTALAQRRIEIAERVRIARQRKRLTQSEVAELLNCSRKRINDVEKGLSTLSALEIDMLSEALGFPHEFFYRRDL